MAKQVLWLIPLVPVFFAVWIYFDLQVAMVAAMIGVFLLFSLQRRKSSVRFNARVGRDAKVSPFSIEKLLLQDLASEISEDIRLEFASPSVLQLLKDSELAPSSIEYANASRSLSGLCGSDRHFCATHVVAGYMQEYQDAQKRLQKVPKTVFQGLFLIMDFPELQKGWVKIRTDNLEAIGWLANEWRSAKDENYVRLENPEFERYFHVQASDRQSAFQALSADIIIELTDFWRNHPKTPLVIHLKDGLLTATSPMAQSPFHIKNNESLWGEDLQVFQQSVQLVWGVTTAFSPNRMDSSRRSA